MVLLDLDMSSLQLCDRQEVRPPLLSQAGLVREALDNSQ
jgi:hypothetical protein